MGRPSHHDAPTIQVAISSHPIVTYSVVVAGGGEPARIPLEVSRESDSGHLAHFEAKCGSKKEAAYAVGRWILAKAEAIEHVVSRFEGS